MVVTSRIFSVSSSAKIEKIKREAAIAQRSNPYDDAVSTASSITMNTSQSGTLTNRYDTQNNANLFVFTGGRPTLRASGTQAFVFPVASIVPSTGGNLSSVLPSTPSYNAWSWTATFRTSASDVEIALVGSTTGAGNGIRILIDGKYISKTTTSFATTGLNYAVLAFGNRKSRLITIEGSGLGAFWRVGISTIDRISPPSVFDPVRVFVSGDSYSEPQGATNNLYGYVPILARRMGWSDVRSVAVGSTGYKQNASGTRSTIRQQIPRWLSINNDLTAEQIDLIMFMGGYNDVTMINAATATVAEVRDEAILAWQDARAAFPNTPIIVGGPWSGSRGAADPNTVALENAFQSAVASSGIQNIYFLAVETAPNPLFSGTGYVNSPQGNGVADWAIGGVNGSDPVHPNDAGHEMMSAWLADSVRNLIMSIK